MRCPLLGCPAYLPGAYPVILGFCSFYASSCFADYSSLDDVQTWGEKLEEHTEHRDTRSISGVGGTSRYILGAGL